MVQMNEKRQEIEISKMNEASTFQNDAKLNVSHDIDKTKLSNAYHESEIAQNERIIKTATRIIWAGFGVICFGIIMAIFEKTTTAIIIAVSGVITEFISGIIFGFISFSNKSKMAYFNQLSYNEEGEKYLQVVMTLDNKKAQEKLVDKLVTNYCERRKSEK